MASERKKKKNSHLTRLDSFALNLEKLMTMMKNLWHNKKLQLKVSKTSYSLNAIIMRMDLVIF
jgi:hypothetical protein